jgi:hypothetical protein
MNLEMNFKLNYARRVEHSFLYIILLVLLNLTLASKRQRNIRHSNAIDSKFVQDPRKNASLYDLKLKRNTQYGENIGNVRDVLLRRSIINKTTRINKFKLIYFSAQFITNELFEQNDKAATLAINKNINNTNLFSFSSLTESLFSINSLNGSINIHTPSNEPTLEYLCVKKSICSCYSCIFSLNIIYSIDSSTNKVKSDTIRVFIDDYNDYAPEFYTQIPEFVLNISESSRIGDQFKLIDSLAYDLDAYYNEVSYYISDRDIFSSNDPMEARSSLFEISTQFNTENSKDLILVLKSHLDYEVRKRYVLYLVAKDNGDLDNMVLKVSKRVIVNVLDFNDNSPICEKSLFIESVKENRVMRDFMHIRASDADSGPNAKLHFSILPNLNNFNARRKMIKANRFANIFEDAEDENEIFDINKDTGWLSLKKPLDYEKKSFYELIVKVNDSGYTNSFTILCNARINVIE